MPLNRDTIERQLQRAKEVLADREKKMDADGVAAADRSGDPNWRSLRSKCRRLGARLRANVAFATLNEELKQRKIAKAAAAEAGEEPEAKPEKKAKVKKKGDGGGEPKAKGEGKAEGKPEGKGEKKSEKKPKAKKEE